MLLLRYYLGDPGFDIYPELFAKLECCHICPPFLVLDECRRWKTRKCIAFAFVLCHLENTSSHINKIRELKQRGRECQREYYKTIHLITEYNHLTWECNHLAHRSPENKRNVGICRAKSLTGFKLDATYDNIMQHSPTWCTNERNMFCPTCWHNMLRSFARALTMFLLREELHEVELSSTFRNGLQQLAAPLHSVSPFQQLVSQLYSSFNKASCAHLFFVPWSTARQVTEKIAQCNRTSTLNLSNLQRYIFNHCETGCWKKCAV